MTVFGQMNANLVRAAGFQAAFDERVVAQAVDGPHVRDRRLARVGQVGAAAAAVTAIANQPAFDGLGGHDALRDGQVAAANTMHAKLLPQVFFRLRRAGEHHQAARVAVQAMHGAYPPEGCPARTALPVGEQSRQQLVEGRLKLPLRGDSSRSSACRVEVMPAGF